MTPQSVSQLVQILTQVSQTTWDWFIYQEPEWQTMESIAKRYPPGLFLCLMTVAGLNDYQLKGKAEVAYWPPLRALLSQRPPPTSLVELKRLLTPFYATERLGVQKVQRLERFLQSPLAQFLAQAPPERVARGFQDVWRSLAATVRPVVGGRPEAVLRLDEFRKEWPLLRTAFLLAQELYEVTDPGSAADLGIGPTFDELLEVTREYIDKRITCPPNGDPRDIGIYNWRRQACDVLENAIRGAGTGTALVPILTTPEWLDSAQMRRFQWTGILAEGKKCHTNKVPCHTNLEKKFADFLDRAKDVVRYLKNERFGFSVTYYENNRPRQFYPDFIVAVREKDGTEVMWLAETKGEMRTNVPLKNGAAELWCQKMNTSTYGQWRYLFAQQRKLESAISKGVSTFAELAQALG